MRRILFFLALKFCYFCSTGQVNNYVELKNGLSISVINSINNVFKSESIFFKEGFVKPTYSVSGAISYERMLNKKNGIVIGLGYENQKIKRTDVIAKSIYFDKYGNSTIRQYKIDETMSINGYISTNFNYLRKLYQKGNFSFYTLLGGSYNFLVLELEKSGSNYCDFCNYGYDVMPEKNFKLNLGAKIDYNLTNRFKLEMKPFYDFFLNKSQYGLRYYSYGVNIGLGYKW